MKNKLCFKVIVEDYCRGIQFVNFFDFGQWEGIKSELKSLKKKLVKLHNKHFFPKNIDIKAMEKDFLELAEQHFVTKTYEFNQPTCIRDFIDAKLRRECMYYFWAKCEYEVVIQGWPNKDTDKKIDVYDQLDANWAIFSELVFNELGV